MSMPLTPEIRWFDSKADVTVTSARLPHWHQAGTVYFLTWRTWDSMPKAVLDEWLRARDAWLRSKHIDPRQPDWRNKLHTLSPSERDEYRTLISDRWDASLDRCEGSCPLATPECAEVVAQSLRHFDGERYGLSDFVVMPNHVHILVSFVDEDTRTKQCDSWKHFTATRINRLIGRSGRFWEPESFDHLVRSEEQYEHLRHYIAANPKRAGSKEGQFVLFQLGFCARSNAFRSDPSRPTHSRSEWTTLKANS
jgi:putative transposase